MIFSRRWNAGREFTSLLTRTKSQLKYILRDTRMINAHEFPAAVPEIPVTDMNAALDYYHDKLGFNVDWGGADGGIAGISKGHCRMFLTDRYFREHHGNA